MNYITYEDFMKTDLYEEFIRENSDIGYLTVQAFTAYGAVPLSDTSIAITKNIGPYQVIFFNGKTNSSGIISNISLPAPPKILALNPQSIPLYALYDLTAINEKYQALQKYVIGMFGGEKVIQYIKMGFDDKGENNNAS